MIAAKNAQEENMHAILYHRYGPPDVVEYTDVEKPSPGPDQALTLPPLFRLFSIKSSEEMHAAKPRPSGTSPPNPQDSF
jgi:hypothetical protein